MSGSTDIATAQDAALSTIEEARHVLDRLADLQAVREIDRRAEAAAHYYRRAIETRHLAARATEIRVWAERRAGQLLLEEHDDVEAMPGAVARDLGTNGQTIRRWLNLATAPEGVINAVLDEVSRDDVELTVTGVERRLFTKSMRRIERGIYINYLGRYVLRWRRWGVTRTKMLGSDLTAARHEYLLVTGKITPAGTAKNERGTPTARIRDAYEEVRRALWNIDKAALELPQAAREHARSAYKPLWEAEERLGQALAELRSVRDAA